MDGKPLAETYVHTGMVGLDGEKMSKSLGNLVLVSKLRAAGVEPVAIRAVLLGQHYRSDWFWTDELLVEGQRRVERWRKRIPGTTLSEATAVITRIRARLANDLNAPAALAVLDAFSVQEPAAQDDSQGAGGKLLADALDALLGLKLF